MVFIHEMADGLFLRAHDKRGALAISPEPEPESESNNGLCVCVFYSSYCRTYHKAVRVGGKESGGHVLS